MTEESLPFAGLRVVDASSFIAGPAAATILGDFGADVIKVESPDGGDTFRNFHTSPVIAPHEVNYCWELVSRNKRSIALDLKTPAARAVFHRLVAAADILVTNYPFPVRAKLGLRYADLSALNPRLIYASLSGYGETGPDADRPGYDTTAYFARSGLIAATTVEGAPPSFSVPAQGDHPTGTSLFAAIMMALWRRERTGKGAEVSTSLLGNGLWANGLIAQGVLLGGTLPPRMPRTQPRTAFPMSYLTADGRWMNLAVVNEDKDWPVFCRLVDRPDLAADPRFADTPTRRANALALMPLLEAEFAKRTLAEWQVLLRGSGITYGFINRVSDVVDDPQAEAAGAIRPTANPAMPRAIANPIRVDFAEQRPAGPAPTLGQHTDEILREIGIGEAEVAALRESGAIR